MESRAFRKRGPRAVAGLSKISPYPRALSQNSAQRLFKLDANENPFGASPYAIEAGRLALEDISRYPDGDYPCLRRLIAGHYELDPARIVFGAGSDELLYLITRAYVRPGDSVVLSQHGFVAFALAGQQARANIFRLPEQSYVPDFCKFASLTNNKPRVIFLANPNNPTGTYIPLYDLIRSIRDISSETLVVVDEAYYEFCDFEDYGTLLEAAGELPNVVVLRTFSKAYGLAGMRVGWAYCPDEVAYILDRVRPVFSLSNVAESCAAAAFQDRHFLSEYVSHVRKMRPEIVQFLTKAGFDVISNAGNFVCFGIDREKLFSADRLCNFLESRGVLVRGLKIYGMHQHLRVSIGTRDAMEFFCECIGEFISEQRYFDCA